MAQTLPSLGHLQPLLNSDFRRKKDNLKVRAQLNPPRTTATGGLEIQMRLVKTGPKTKLIPGDVIIGSKGRKYLLIGQGKDERNTEGQGVFKSVELDKETVILRTRKIPDLKTKRVNETLFAFDIIDYTELPLKQSEDTLRIPMNNYEIITDFPLLIGDKIREGINVNHNVPQIISYETAVAQQGYAFSEIGFSESGYGGTTQEMSDAGAQFLPESAFGENGYNEFGFGGGTINPDYYGIRTLVVHQVERRYGAYWARVQDV